MAKEFEFREEKIIRSVTGHVTEVREAVFARRTEDQIKSIYHDMGIGHRRNLREGEDFSRDIVHSVVRVK